MERRQLGATDMRVSPLGFGGAEIGFEEAAQGAVERLLGAALDAGLNVIDTAECYMESETLIGKAASGRRKDFYLFTKCGHADGWEHADWTKPALLASIQRSLQRLGTDHLDLIQLHSCSLAELQRGECIGALEEARRRGFARYIGYSGDGDAAQFAIESGRFQVLQTSVSVADQESIDRLLPRAVRAGMGVIAKRPIANAAWRHKRKPQNEYHWEYWERFTKLDYDFLRQGQDDPASVALRFTLSQSGVHTAIVGTKNPERWRQNAGLLAAGPLAADRIAAIRARWREVAPASWVGQT